MRTLSIASQMFFVAIVSLTIVSFASAQTEEDSVRVPETKTSATLSTSRKSPFSLTPKDYSRQVVIDSTGQVVTLREDIFGSDASLPTTMSFKEYLRRRIQAERARMWSEMAGKYNPTGAYDPFADLGKLYLPIKPNPIISIFGKPGISLNVGGAVDIRLGIRAESSDQPAALSPIGTQISPIFDQNLNVNVNGTVGDKLKIGADWNTQRTFNFENQLKIRYDGYNDEIIQSVEAGNVSLPQTNSLISGGGALFGVKMGMKFGPLKLTAVASQRKGEKKTVSVSNGAQGRTDSISRKAYEYAQNHYFIDTAYRARFEKYYSTTPPSATYLDSNLYVSKIEVWERTNAFIIDPHNEREGICRIDAERWARPAGTDPINFGSPLPDEAGVQEHGRFRKLDSARYHFDPYTGVLSLNYVPGPEATIAVGYIRTSGRDTAQVGSYQSKDSTRIYLKLVKPQYLAPGGSMARAWLNQLKNIYSLGATNISQGNFRLELLYVPPDKPTGTEYVPGNTSKLVTIEGWDRLSGTTAGTDGKFDFPTDGKFPVYLSRGDIIFPTLRPFDSTLGAAGGVPSYIRYPLLYDTTYTVAEADSHSTRFQITGCFNSSKSVIPLNAFSIIDGSVRVTMNGKLMHENVDYIIDYYGGTVTMTNAEAALPNSNVVVEFEQNDFFNVASKSLLGLRGDIPLSKNTMFGFTMINYNQKTLSDKVRLGEEPLNNSMIGIDGTGKYELPFLSSLFSFLPRSQCKPGVGSYRQCRSCGYAAEPEHSEHY